ncbi:MAG: dockerin type I repeat-containing protein [Oscillospiraceae bacterium]|nr:dockerin type I repeat-containing protein [Oscillospiraceae bacterium]
MAIHCPVDVELLDENGKCIASIINNEVVKTDSTDILVIAWIEGDAKYISVIGTSNVTVKMIGTDTGSMDCYFASKSEGELMTESYMDFESVKLEQGKQMKLELSSSSNNTISVLDSNGTETEKIEPTLHLPASKYGDLNLDSSLSVADAVMMNRLLVEDKSLELSQRALLVADYNCDGYIDLLDVMELLKYLQTRPAI